MKLDIYLTAAGQENIAKGNRLNYWDFELRLTAGVGVDEWKCQPPTNGFLVASEVDVFPPTHDVCVQGALKALEAERQRIQLEAANTLRELAGRANKLQAISYSPAPAAFPEVL